MKYTEIKAASLINLFVGLAELILGLRVIFKLFDAHQTVSFVNWIYNTSAVLLTPFRGIFSAITVSSPRYVLDINALFAMAIYAAAGALLINFLVSTGPKRK